MPCNLKVGSGVRLKNLQGRYRFSGAGIVKAIYGEIQPFHWLVEFCGGDGIFPGDELEEIPMSETSKEVRDDS